MENCWFHLNPPRTTERAGEGTLVDNLQTLAKRIQQNHVLNSDLRYQIEAFIAS